MLKQTITYKDLDGVDASATLWFNLTDLELKKDVELEVLQARFQKFNDEVYGDGQRELTGPEVREFYRMVEVLVKASYGVRYGPDNKLFDKDPQVFKEFNDSGKYSGFMRWLFDDEGVRANIFITQIWPDELQDAVASATAETSRGNLHSVQDVQLPGEVAVAPDDTKSIEGIKNSRGLDQLTDEDILQMSDKDFSILTEESKNGNNIPSRLLFLGFQRKQEGGGTPE